MEPKTMTKFTQYLPGSQTGPEKQHDSKPSDSVKLVFSKLELNSKTLKTAESK